MHVYGHKIQTQNIQVEFPIHLSLGIIFVSKFKFL